MEDSEGEADAEEDELAAAEEAVLAAAEEEEGDDDGVIEGLVDGDVGEEVRGGGGGGAAGALRAADAAWAGCPRACCPWRAWRPHASHACLLLPCAPHDSEPPQGEEDEDDVPGLGGAASQDMEVGAAGARTARGALLTSAGRLLQQDRPPPCACPHRPHHQPPLPPTPRRTTTLRRRRSWMRRRTTTRTWTVGGPLAGRAGRAGAPAAAWRALLQSAPAPRCKLPRCTSGCTAPLRCSASPLPARPPASASYPQR